ncbi:MAG: VWA domain-containing protein, partial [Roseiflexaceae bacterium]|nr:VWA domain-containing protein [Roseiflexaceae bacterium]
VAQLQKRALDAAARAPSEAARLLYSAADRLDELGAQALAQASREQAAALPNGASSELGLKELSYATRRLGA